jgi:hypothetical protein
MRRNRRRSGKTIEEFWGISDWRAFQRLYARIVRSPVAESIRLIDNQAFDQDSWFVMCALNLYVTLALSVVFSAKRAGSFHEPADLHVHPGAYRRCLSGMSSPPAARVPAGRDRLQGT